MTNTSAGERADISSLLDDQRSNFLITVRGLDDAAARTRSTVSDLTLGGLVKHLTETERSWITTILEPEKVVPFDMDTAMAQYYMTDEETLDGLLEEYAQVARRTADTIATIEDLDALIALPPAPWDPEPQPWSVRRILLHVLRETAHHSGHADIIRESLDGGNTTQALGEAAGLEF
ncbi:DinB family protein [Rhodococcus triatomae]|uniref:DinB family protein n=1 Tax=Rhodococcus triatomae TaxID=300028 RepID=A0A1G8PP80_9NOCA|nr:DinB family protein [Rhodococcus triatomae]QNG20160.1 DinB family protein [Rhodococcus triatomae]QNG23924.1 DinB family protein [Rhodococcus triatomae]SDI94314.1 Protein of unknown function [Rhodococcus triatomae]